MEFDMVVVSKNETESVSKKEVVKTKYVITLEGKALGAEVKAKMQIRTEDKEVFEQFDIGDVIKVSVDLGVE